ncbi:MAG: glycerol-3-phosphate acyltransferase [Firmicutes bacterium]|nr:glycerol-3-phosphate acyltransferase [Bacillota bacterium]
MHVLLIALYSYLLGALPSAYLIGKFKHVDITSEGSGNIGGTNAYRVLGAKLGVLVALMDVGKVIAALLITMNWWGGEALAVATSALFAVVGHNWSVYVGFRGGKGIAVSIGTYVFLFPGLGLVGLLIALFNVIVTKYVSLGSLNFVAAMTALLWTVPGYALEYRILSVLLMAMAVYRHRSNITRLREGSERRFGQS